MEDHFKFFDNLNRKRPRSQSMDEKDQYMKNSYLNWIKSQLDSYLSSSKTFRQITGKIQSWLKELKSVRNEVAETDEELNFLTQKLHDVSISENILYLILDFLEEHQEEKIGKKNIMDFLDSLGHLNKKSKNLDFKPKQDETVFINNDNEYEKDSETSNSDNEEENDEDSEEDDDDDDDDEEEDNNDEEDDEEYLPPNSLGAILISLGASSGSQKKPFLSDWNKRFEEIRESSSKNMSTDQCHDYLNKMKPEDRDKLLAEAERVEGLKRGEKPMYFQILDLPLPLEERKNILREYHSLSKAGSKGKVWLTKLLSLPFGVLVGKDLDDSDNVKKFIKKLYKKMDEAVFGHQDAKKRIVQILCQGIRNPNAKGLVMGIEGPPGNGKTSLIENGISKVMGRPFIPISLGGASDASYLDGHSFTYEGSIPGKIAEALIEAKCMNPIFYFDELDKVSKTHKGMEIINLLVHLIDPSQNHHFRDKYFHGVSIDLSKATFIFSFNDRRLIDRILLDRITVIKTKGLDIEQKKIIARDYLMPSILKEVGLKNNDVVFSDDLIKEVAEKYTFEGGVRRLKEILFHLVREFNVYNLSREKFNDKKIKFPLNFTTLEEIYPLLKDYRPITHQKVNDSPKIGVVNGLWAGTMGVGGILPIELTTFPCNTAFTIKKTGSLEKVIQESIEVAQSVSWNFLDDETKEKWTKHWKDRTEGFHIHCPDGATPKDGPSAGTALSLLFYSFLTHTPIPNTLAITGEMNLQGKVTEIGGLKEKTFGAKTAGAKVVLYPKDNQKDMDKILEENKDLLSDSFRVHPVDRFEEVIEIVRKMNTGSF